MATLMTVKTLDHAVQLRLVAGCTISDNVKLVTQIIPQLGFELGTSIRSDSGWGPKTSYPPAEESIGDRFGFKLYKWYGFRPTREPIDTSQQIFKTVRVCQRADYVDLYVI